MIKTSNEINLLCKNDCIQNKFKYDIELSILTTHSMIKHHPYRDEKYFRYLSYHNSLSTQVPLTAAKNLVNLCKWLRSHCSECAYDQEIPISFLLRILALLNLKFFQTKVQICISESPLAITKPFNRSSESLKGQCKSFIDIISMHLCIWFFPTSRTLKFDVLLHILALPMRTQVRKVINVTYRFLVFQRRFK